MWIDIEQVDLNRLAIEISAGLSKWVTPENSYNEEITLEPLFIVQHSSCFDIGIFLNSRSRKQTAIVGYSAGYSRYKWSSNVYETISDSIVFDTLIGDYPKNQADFSRPGRIVWAGTGENKELRAQSLDEFLGFYRDLNKQSRQKIWLNDDLIPFPEPLDIGHRNIDE